jgi:hypothetical protein
MPPLARGELPWKIRQMGLPLAGDMITQDPLASRSHPEGVAPYQIDDGDLDVYRRPFLKVQNLGER